MRRYHSLTEDIVDYKKINLQKEYDKYNKLLFNNELPKIPLKWFSSRTVGGKVVTRGVARRPETWVVQYLALSTFLEREENDFAGILIHEMIHVFFDSNKILDRSGIHGIRFKEMAQRLGKQVGFVIPLTDSIEGKNVSSNVPAKNLLAVVIYSFNKPYGIQVWPPNMKDTVIKEYKGYPEETRFFNDKKMMLKFYISNNRNLLRYPIQRKLKSGLQSYKVSDDFIKEIETTGKMIDTVG